MKKQDVLLLNANELWNYAATKNAAYYFLKLTGQAVVRYKQTPNGSRKWNLKDYIDEAFILSEEDTCP